MWIGYKSTAFCWALVTIFLLCCQFSVVLCDMFFCYECMAIVITLVVITLIGKVLFKWFCCCKIVLLVEGTLLRRAFNTWGWRERGGAPLREITLTHTCTCSQTREEKNTFMLTNKKWIFPNARAYRSKSNEADKFVILQASLCLQAYFYCLSYK